MRLIDDKSLVALLVLLMASLQAVAAGDERAQRNKLEQQFGKYKGTFAGGKIQIYGIEKEVAVMDVNARTAKLKPLEEQLRSIEQQKKAIQKQIAEIKKTPVTPAIQGTIYFSPGVTGNYYRVDAELKTKSGQSIHCSTESKGNPVKGGGTGRFRWTVPADADPATITITGADIQNMPAGSADRSVTNGVTFK